VHGRKLTPCDQALQGKADGVYFTATLSVLWISGVNASHETSMHRTLTGKSGPDSVRLKSKWVRHLLATTWANHSELICGSVIPPPNKIPESSAHTRCSCLWPLRYRYIVHTWDYPRHHPSPALSSLHCSTSTPSS
jgi:hypothetical protein